MSLARCVEPEWLDVLDQDDPRASRSRRDLQRVNRVMGNAAILARALRNARPPRLIVELGAGDGTLLLRVVQRPALRWQGGTIMFVDRQSLVSKGTRAAFNALGWTVDSAEADALTWLQQAAPGSVDLMLANLFLHHFHAPQLTALLASAAARADLFVACEPRRSYGAVAGSLLLGAIGCNDVSRHDAVVSVRAGFADRELSALWPASSGHRLEEYAAGLFSHCFVAQRA
ncbi:MAG: methyltransferase domain-containing protein [Nitrospirae bacterium]|nr:MAG: methyltransferase domain-containing protein [Nitrospirota bacterium]